MHTHLIIFNYFYYCLYPNRVVNILQRLQGLTKADNRIEDFFYAAQG